MKLVNFFLSEDKKKELDILAKKEGRTLKDIFTELTDEYLKKHMDGNPQYILDQFDDPGFIACPAFYRDGNTWENYISKATLEEKQKLKNQIILLDKKLGKYI